MQCTIYALGEKKWRTSLDRVLVLARKGEELILRSIEANKGCVSRNALIRELAMPLGVCDDIISVGESGGSEA